MWNSSVETAKSLTSQVGRPGGCHSKVGYVCFGLDHALATVAASMTAEIWALWESQCMNDAGSVAQFAHKCILQYFFFTCWNTG